MPIWPGNRYSLLDRLGKNVSADFRSTKRREMARVLLAVNLINIEMAAHAGQGDQGDFRAVGDSVKHGFTKHGLAYGHKIQPSDQFIIDPGFDAVGKACPMKRQVSFDHLGQDPGARLSIAGSCGTADDDLFKGKIDANLAVGGAGELSHGLSQRRVQSEVGDFQNHSGVRAPPQNWLMVVKPRENASLVGILETLNRQITARTQQSGCHRVGTPSLVNRWKH